MAARIDITFNVNTIEGHNTFGRVMGKMRDFDAVDFVPRVGACFARRCNGCKR